MTVETTLFGTVKLQRCEDDSVYVCHIESLSNALKAEIRAKLVSICRGLAKADKQLPANSYDRTLKEFLRRYNSKTDDTKKGMIAELLTHVLIRHLVANFSPVSPFFNMEESSIKKAFDIVFHCSNTMEIWLTEVKSGHKSKNTAKEKNNSLLHLAKRSIVSQINGGDFHIWDNAINGALISIRESSVRDEIENILSNCFVMAQDGLIDSKNFNIILTSVLYGGSNDKIDISDVEEVKVGIECERIFKGLIVFSIQKETYEAVEQFLRSEAA
ncbi:hypothetical protein [Thalassospira sp. CH_XMU1448-2]|uniref:hypothetical protein n=1 Tax=Thalassospira sp. CH_XMU1448-2 TaxID=3107773 RepID=UPI003008CE5B